MLVELQTDVITQDDWGLANHMGDCEELAPGMWHSATFVQQIIFSEKSCFYLFNPL